MKKVIFSIINTLLISTFAHSQLDITEGVVESIGTYCSYNSPDRWLLGSNSCNEPRQLKNGFCGFTICDPVTSDLDTCYLRFAYHSNYFNNFGTPTSINSSAQFWVENEVGMIKRYELDDTGGIGNIDTAVVSIPGCDTIRYAFMLLNYKHNVFGSNQPYLEIRRANNGNNSICNNIPDSWNTNDTLAIAPIDTTFQNLYNQLKGLDTLGCTNPDAYNYDPNVIEDDGTCQTCSDGIQNGDEMGIDCGSMLVSNCPPCQVQTVPTLSQWSLILLTLLLLIISVIGIRSKSNETQLAYNQR